MVTEYIHAVTSSIATQDNCIAMDQAEQGQRPYLVYPLLVLILVYWLAKSPEGWLRACPAFFVRI